jgi:hypothetical protein
MKYLFRTTFIVAIILGLTSVELKSQSFEVGQKNLSFGVGFGSPWVNTGYYSTIPPISAAFDYGLRDDYGPGVISVGGYFGIAGYRYEYPSINFGWSYTTAIFMGRAAYHYEFAENLDSYAGLGIGFRTVTSREYGTMPVDGTYIGDSGIKMAGTLYVGAKYYFSPNFAGFAELGYGISIFTLGVSLKM